MEPRDIKCTNSQRTTASQVLADAMSVGQLSVAEFEERSSACTNATTRGELLDLVSDLLEDPGRVLFGGHEVASKSAHELNSVDSELASTVDRALTQVEPSVRSAQSLSLGIFGGTTVRSTPIASRHTTMGIFGGTDVDLRGASLRDHVTTIEAVGVFGGVDLWIPEGFRVRVSGIGLFGGHDIKVDRGAIDPADLPASAPEVVVNCFSLFGGVDVHVVKR
ncbi:DUF1707 SHOCT-like domain-containing protein [Corynebacterium guaraldiae]|uniref:DUF1707 SHOCT-like domain-containing protein n=1 Tax=Corynebacterium sp. HMSC069E04 TaxID=1739400 RepID=UPI0008A2260B|nr:DUF1707 domain-containing protein [Corynebacterium sp. HMSC069E04]OFS40635.1 hypothetical protein HMPREF2896_03115 [Corynebacterium sp. HMSC069E04]